MRTSQLIKGEIDSARIALLFGLSIGLGIVLHEGFFVIAGVVAICVVTTALAHTIHQHAEQTRSAYRMR